MTTEKLKQAIEFIRAGSKDKARLILKEVILDNPKNETAWLWFVESQASDQQRITAYELWLKVNPESETAKKGLTDLATQMDRVAYGDNDYALPERDILPRYQRQNNHNMAIVPATLGDTQPLMVGRSARGIQWWTILIAIFSVLAVGSIVVYFGSQMMGYDLSWGSLFAEEKYCNCGEAEAYLSRVKRRVENWRTHQALYQFAGSLGDIPDDVSYAQQLYEEEKNEQPPECLDDAHELFLSLLTYHLRYTEALRTGNATSAEFYLTYEMDVQAELAAEFERISREFVCTP